MTPALAKMREYYGTAKREESPPPETSGRAGTERDGGEAQHAFAGGAQVAKKIARTASHGNLDNHPDAAEPVASSSADRSTHEGGGSKYGSALSGGAMPATAFQGRDRALMSPPKPLSGPPAAAGSEGRAASGFFDALKKPAARRERRSSPARRPDSDSRRGALKPSSIRERRWGVVFGGGAASSPAGRKGKGTDRGGVCSHEKNSKVKWMISSLAATRLRWRIERVV